MKEFKNKEIIIGFIVIVILAVIALGLLIKRGLNDDKEINSVVTEEIKTENSEESSEEQLIPNVTEIIDEDNEADEMTEEELESIRKEEEIKNRRYTLYTILGEEKYQSKTMKQRTTEDGQLKELYEYWDSYRLDAVAELVRLERLQKISEELKESNSFYYYGNTDHLGRPSGKGLAVYEDNNYYFGDWKDGLRDGKGMWLQVAIYGEENKYANLGVIEHSYNGSWKKDLPHGEGQEHFSYDYDILKEDYMAYGFAVANVLGNFSEGYYDGEMYIMTVDEHGTTMDWAGTCDMGIWDPIIEGDTTDAVWESYEKDEQGNPFYHFIFPKENEGYGIHGLMK